MDSYTGIEARRKTLWYCSTAGPALGLVMFGETSKVINVLESPGDRAPVGTAICIGLDGGKVAIWRLTVRGAELPGRWIILDREFRPAQ
jgi:hypothetical protein